jgi:hypothetical protein
MLETGKYLLSTSSSQARIERVIGESETGSGGVTSFDESVNVRCLFAFVIPGIARQVS